MEYMSYFNVMISHLILMTWETSLMQQPSYMLSQTTKKQNFLLFQFVFCWKLSFLWRTICWAEI